MKLTLGKDEEVAFLPTKTMHKKRDFLFLA